VAVNNQHMLEFRHRLPYQQANHLAITGDVRLTQVSIFTSVLKSFCSP
jgi:hypothetical protein